MVVIKLFKDNLNDSFFNKLGNIFYKVFRLFTDLSSENAKVFMIILVLSIVIFLVVYNLLELLKNQMKVVKQNLSQVSRWFGGFIGLCTGFVLALFTVYVMMLLYPIDKTTIVIKTFIKLIEVLKI